MNNGITANIRRSLPQNSHIDLQNIQKYFHELILERAKPIPSFVERVKNGEIILPEITNKLFGKQDNWFPVPGMYGGFKYELVNQDGKPVLKTESWCRVVGGSGQAHEITNEGCTLTDEGFV